jgi:hypothetical protein
MKSSSDAFFVEKLPKYAFVSQLLVLFPPVRVSARRIISVVLLALLLETFYLFTDGATA